MATPRPLAVSQIFTIGDFVETTSDAPPEYRQRVGFITETGPGHDEYRVEFEDGDTPTTGYLNAVYLREAQDAGRRRSR
jgi:hypothetical protein